MLIELGKGRRARLVALAVVLATALVVRLYAVQHSDNIARDGAVFLEMARAMRQDPAAAIHDYAFHPGYPAAVATAASLVGASWPDGWITAGRGISIVCSLIALVGLYVVAARTFSPGLGLLTVLIAALCTEFTTISSDVLSDAPAMAMAATAVALALAGRRRLGGKPVIAMAMLVGAGLAGGLGYLVRPEYLLAAVVAAAVVAHHGGEPAPARRRWLGALVVLAVAAACVTPYAIAIGGFTHKKSLEDFVLVGASGVPLAMVAPGSAGVWGAALRMLDRLRSAIGTPATVLAPVALLTWFAQYVLKLRLPKEVTVVPSASGGLVMLIFTAVMAMIVTVLELNRGPGYISSRHMLMPAFFLMPAAAAGAMMCAGWMHLALRRLAGTGALTRQRSGAILASAATATIVALVLVGATAALRAFVRPHHGKGCYRLAGQDIRDKLGPGQFVLAPDAWVPFFADARSDQFHTSSPTPFWLTPADWAGADPLLARCAVVGGEREVVLAVTQDMLDASADRDLLTHLRASKRATLFNLYHNNTDAVWVFRVAPPGTP